MNVTDLLNQACDLLQKGIENSDWSHITEAYFTLTGDELSVPENNSTATNTDEFIKTVMDRLTKLESKTKSSEKKEPKTSKKTAEFDFKTKSNKPSRKVSDRKKENKFEQMHNEVFAEAEQEKDFDKIDDNIKPSQRTRKAYSPKSVACTVCGGINEVNPLFAREMYTCDSCIAKRKFH